MNYLQNWFRCRAPWVERYLFSSALIAGAMLIVVQLVMTDAGVRYYLSRIESLEGIPYHLPDEIGDDASSGCALEGVYWVEFKLRRGEEPLEVLRNGFVAAVLRSASVIVYVNPGDMLEIRGEITQAKPAEIEVISTRGLVYPRVGTRVTTHGDYELIGWAVPRNGE